jgi:nitrite reductase (NO-forming)
MWSPEGMALCSCFRAKVSVMALAIHSVTTRSSTSASRTITSQRTLTARGLTPTHIAFNGKYGALTADIRLEAAVGETVLMLHSQAKNPSFPHLIGGHGDWVYPYGKFGNKPDANLESWDVVAGGTAAAVYTFKQDGVYAYLNHNLIKAFLFDAKAFIHVTGGWDDNLMHNSFEARPITAN